MRISRHPARHIADLDFSHDIALIESLIDSVGTLKNLNEHAKATGLIVNCEKTEHLRLNINHTAELKLGEKTIIEVDDFKYLGFLIAPTF